MAGMSGIEVLERLRFVPTRHRGGHDHGLAETTSRHHCAVRRYPDRARPTYINKPFDIATIRAAVSAAMQRRMLESEIHSSAEKVQRTARRNCRIRSC